MPRKQPQISPEDKDTQLLVIDPGGGVVHGVETTIADFRGAKSLLLGDKKDSKGGRDEIVIEDTDWIVSPTERVAISDCAWLLTPLSRMNLQGNVKPPAANSSTPASAPPRNGFVVVVPPAGIYTAPAIWHEASSRRAAWIPRPK